MQVNDKGMVAAQRVFKIGQIGRGLRDALERVAAIAIQDSLGL